MHDWRDLTDRPAIQCLVARVCPAFGLLTRPRVVDLEEAVQLHELGYTVLVDPESHSDFVRWEQWQRVIR